MSTEDKKRATLDFGGLDNTPAPPVDNNAVKAATRAAGFRETPKAASSEAAPTIRAMRRTRRKTGRTEQFATRLRAETIEAIYNYADHHEITLAETIERAIEALKRGAE
ncbi:MULTISPECIES: stability/partitioning determinant [Rhizobium/Agrobacterium group]|uniref:stability/partitioning determinant n=1 Tax=Rhizobium/Agrobacterium group TaxID=227290 RepID=UPI000985E9BB|nr:MULTISPECIES: stability/partitioning determinant [Rhizobium/Agrobacterium group]NTA51281.1 stability/partitioning determinant [Agrobacterium tumefaciens]TIX93587.1 stability/partitioning determinant [Rhizobium sp. P44RR-XXIV]